MAFLGEDIPKLGFGLMRLPQKGGVIDIEQTKQMVDRFLEEGYTYFDTAWAYAGSEDAIRQALVERHPRESYQLASKVSAWINCNSKEDAVEQFETTLRRTGAGYIDYYLLHNLGDIRTEPFERFGLWEHFLEEKRKGRIRHLGFSIHASAEQLDEVLTKHPEAEFVQLQINYADWEDATVQSRRCYEVARRHGKPIIIMEPVKGGLLAHPPSSTEEILRNADPDLTPAAWAIRYCADLEGVITVLSGMSTIEQMEDSIACMKGFTHLTEEERKTIELARDDLESYGAIQCTSCNYCAKVCPQNIGISGSLGAMNNIIVYGNEAAATRSVRFTIDLVGRKRPGSCIKCGACEDACPQHLKIIGLLEKAAKYLG